MQKKWCSMSQYFTGSQLKIHMLQNLLVLQSWYNVTTDATWKLCRSTKIVLLLGVSTCRAASFKCLRHIHLSLRQSTTYPSMTSKPYSLSYFEHNSNWYFSIHSLWRYSINWILKHSYISHTQQKDRFLWTALSINWIRNNCDKK